MKRILDSSEVFEAYARIDYNYWQLKNVYSELFEKSSIEGMIDKVTGYDKKLLNDAIIFIEDIIKDKQFLEADTEKDKETLEKLKTIKI